MRRGRAAALRVNPRAAARPWQIHLALAGAQVGFALFPIFGKLALASIPPFLFAAFRVVAAAILLDGIRRAQAPEKIRAADRPRLVLYALLGVSFNQVLFIFGLFLTTAINTTILTTTIPVFTLGRGRPARTREDGPAGRTRHSPGGRRRARAAERAAFRLEQRFLSRRPAPDPELHVLLALPGPVAARSSPTTGPSPSRRPSSATERSSSSLVAIPDLLRFQPSRVPPLAWACLAAVILLCTVIPYLLNAWALARTHASRVAFYVFLQPLIATALAIPILGEALSFKTVVAGLLIFAGLAVTVLSGRPQPTADETLSV